MRQTLLVEQMVKQGIANDFIHIAIIPTNNIELLDNNYNFSEHDLQTTWRNCIKNQNKFRIIDSRKILELIQEMPSFATLANYLTLRYY